MSANHRRTVVFRWLWLASHPSNVSGVAGPYAPR